MMRRLNLLFRHTVITKSGSCRISDVESEIKDFEDEGIRAGRCSVHVVDDEG